MTLMVTDGCNLKCSMCFIWKKEEVFLDLQELKSLYERNKKGLCWINISGGEPTMNPSLNGFLDYLTQKLSYSIISLTTNGTASLNEKVKSLANKNPTLYWYLYTSLDEVGERHDQNRGKKGLYIDIKNELENKIELSNVNQGVSFTILPKNQNRLEYILSEIYKLTKNININIGQSSDYYNHQHNKELESKKHIYYKVLPYLNIYSIEGLMKAIFFKLWSRGSSPLNCHSTKYNILVDTFGNIRNCTLYYDEVYTKKDWVYSKEENEILNKKKVIIEKNKCENSCFTPCETYIHILVSFFSLKVFKLFWIYITAIKDYKNITEKKLSLCETSHQKNSETQKTYHTL